MYSVFVNGSQFWVKKSNVNGSIAFFDNKELAENFKLVIKRIESEFLSRSQFNFDQICEQAKQECKVGRYKY